MTHYWLIDLSSLSRSSGWRARSGGWILGTMALRADCRKLPAVLALILDLPNTGVAAIFALAALMGG